MSTPTITNIDNGYVAMGDNEYKSDVLTLAGADTIVKGTILATDTSTNKYVLFVKGGATNGNGIPTAVIENEVTSTGAGDVSIRPIISGLVSSTKLIIDADGDGSNVDNVVLDALKASSIVGILTTELNALEA